MPSIKAPLVYNGDIVSVESFVRIKGILNDGPSTGSGACKTVEQFMLGRGILANPFLAEQIKNDIADACDASLQVDPVGTHNVCPPTHDKTERLHNYLLDLYEDRLYHAGGSPKVLGRMKELWSYLMYSFDEPQDIWRKIKKINALKEYEEAVETVFRSHTLRSIT
jgi:tRNA-dihydrouridine synthase